jgi:hemin uptake protein HemP
MTTDATKREKSGDQAGRRAGSPVAPVRTLHSRDLFVDAREVIIEHDGARYRLQRTSKGKLILTK